MNNSLFQHGHFKFLFKNTFQNDDCFDLLIIFIISLYIFISYFYFQFLAVRNTLGLLSSREKAGFVDPSS